MEQGVGSQEPSRFFPKSGYNSFCMETTSTQHFTEGCASIQNHLGYSEEFVYKSQSQHMSPHVWTLMVRQELRSGSDFEISCSLMRQWVWKTIRRHFENHESQTKLNAKITWCIHSLTMHAHLQISHVMLNSCNFDFDFQNHHRIRRITSEIFKVHIEITSC
jgi:hypothetical protein